MEKTENFDSRNRMTIKRFERKRMQTEAKVEAFEEKLKEFISSALQDQETKKNLSRQGINVVKNKNTVDKTMLNDESGYWDIPESDMTGF